ncbi:hypothetical protein [Methylobacterium oxalidis]|uniref:hypothetical protein n=1 Tax=Methylobacterium oxalidis TaxID=944322 RepID=UPI003315AB3F
MLRLLVLAGRLCLPEQTRFVPSLPGLSEADVQLLDEDVTVPIINDPYNGFAVLNLKETRCTTLELVVAVSGDERSSLGGHWGLSPVVDAPSPETCLDMKAPPEYGGLV